MIIKLFLFGLLLLKSIYVSTFETIFLFVKSKAHIDTEIIFFPLKTERSFYRLLICQAITLTPGTISVDINSGGVIIHQFVNNRLDSIKSMDKLFCC